LLNSIRTGAVTLNLLSNVAFSAAAAVIENAASAVHKIIPETIVAWRLIIGSMCLVPRGLLISRPSW